MKLDLNKKEEFIKLEVGDVILRDGEYIYLIIEGTDEGYEYMVICMNDFREFDRYGTLNDIYKDMCIEYSGVFEIIKSKDLVLSRLK